MAEPEPQQEGEPPEEPKMSVFARARAQAAAASMAAEEAVRAKIELAQAQAAAAQEAIAAQAAVAEEAARAQAAAAYKVWEDSGSSSSLVDPQQTDIYDLDTSHVSLELDDRHAAATKQGSLEKEGGVFSGWAPLYFVIEEGELLAYKAREDRGEPLLRLTASALAIRRAVRKGREHCFRVDSASAEVEKVVLDAGSAELYDEWVIALGNAGSIVPASFIEKLDEAAAAATRYTATPRQRRIKKGWLDIQAGYAHRASTGSIAEWQQHWFQYEVPVLTVHQRPGAEVLATVKMDEFELVIGPSVEKELGRDFSFKTALRQEWDDANPDAKKMASALPWYGIAAESAADCDLWVQALSTRKVNLRRTHAENYGLGLDDDATVAELLAEPDGEPGPAERAQIRKQQRVRRVNGIMVASKEEVLELIYSEGGQLLEAVEITVEGVGLPPMRADETDEQYEERLRAEDDARMRKELVDEEEQATRAEEELQARQAAEARVEKLRSMDAARHKIEMAGEQHTYMQTASLLSKQLASGKEAERVKALLASDSSRRLYHKGLLSKLNDEQKRVNMAQGIGRSYFFLFSNMLLFTKREGTVEREQTFHIQEVVELEALRSVKLTSHALDAAASERRGITLAPLHLDRSSVAHRQFPFRLYCPSAAEQRAWVDAFRRVLMDEWNQEGQAYGAHHELCGGTLFAAAMHGDVLRVERALRLDPSSATLTDEFGSTALHLAARYGHLDIVDSLVSRGATLVNKMDDAGRTPAHLAAEGGYTAILEALGRANANMNKPDGEDRVPLGIIVSGIPSSVASAGALVRTNSSSSHLEKSAAQEVVRQGGVVDRVDKRGRSGLHDAVASGAVTQLELWLQLGANVDKPVVDSSRVTPLFIAATEISDADERLTVLRMLLEAGAHPNKPGNRSGESVVQVLVDKQDFAAAAACVRAGADNRKISGLTPEQQADLRTMASAFASEQRKAAVKRYAGRAAAAVVGYVEESDVEATIVRRNYLLTLRNGDVTEALTMVSFRGLLTDHLPNLTASAVPFVGVAYSVINPIWTQMRDVCLIAALYGHDIENDKDVQSKILECIIGDWDIKDKQKKAKKEEQAQESLTTKLKGAVAGDEQAVEQAMLGVGQKVGAAVRDKAVKKAMDKLQQKMAEKLAERQASALAIASGPVGTTLSYMYRATVDTELEETNARAQKMFSEGAPGVPQEVWEVEIPSASRFYSWGRAIDRAEHGVRDRGSKWTDAIGGAIGAEAIAEKAGSMATSAATSLDNALSLTERKDQAVAAVTAKKTALVDEAREEAVGKLTAYGQAAVEKIATGIISRIDNQLNLPEFMAEMVKEVVDDVTRGIKANALGIVDQKLAQTLGLAEEDELDEDEGSIQLGCCSKVRAAILYHWMPYDHKIGYMLSDPKWLFLKVLGAIPGGFSFVFQLFIFSLVDRNDEYQLVRMLLDFKALQAITLGIVSLLSGAFSYARCANAEPYSTCHDVGPGQSMLTKLSLIGWIGSWLLSCMVFLLLQRRRRNSMKKKVVVTMMLQLENADQTQHAKLLALELDALYQQALDAGVDPAALAQAVRDAHKDPTAKQSSVKRWLQNLMYYDLVIFLVCAGLTALSAVFGSSFFLYAFWTKCLYGVLAFCWIPTALPIIDEVLACSEATGYDTAGRTRKKTRAKEEESDEESEEAQKEKIINLMLALEGADETQRDALMRLEVRVLRKRATEAGVDTTAMETSSEKVLRLVTGVESDQVLSKILDDMLNVAIKGGNLPIHAWADELAPVFQASADAIALRTDRIRTAAEKRDQGEHEMPADLSYSDQIKWKADETSRSMAAWKEGAMDVARDESATQAKIMIADNAHNLATQAAAMIEASFELPKALGDAIQDIIMSFVPDVTQELDDGIDVWLRSTTSPETPRSPPDGSSNEDGGAATAPPTKRRCSRLLYNWMPFDGAAQQPTEQRRRRCVPQWWTWSTLLRCLAMNSLVGTTYIATIVMWCAIDFSDEYQLVIYIVHFKSIAVVSTGLLLTAVGVVTYMTCVDQTGAEETTALSACDDSMIAVYPAFWPVIALWLISHVLLWLAFRKLLKSHQRSIDANAVPPAAAVDDGDRIGSGGGSEGQVASKERQLRLFRSQTLHSRTRFWLHWDLFAFFVSACVGAFVIQQGTVIEDIAPEVEAARLGLAGGWELRQVVFWCHVLHSLLSLPFLFLSLPLFHLVFTRSAATGYTPEGLCVPLQKQAEDEPEPGSLLEPEPGSLLEPEPDNMEPEPEPEGEGELRFSAASLTFSAASLPSVPNP